MPNCSVASVHSEMTRTSLIGSRHAASRRKWLLDPSSARQTKRLPRQVSRRAAGGVPRSFRRQCVRTLRGRVLQLVGGDCTRGLGEPFFVSSSSEASETPSAALETTAEEPQPGPSATTGRRHSARPARPRRSRPSEAAGAWSRRPRSEGELLEQAVLDGARTVHVAQSQATIQRELLAESRKQTAAMERVADSLERLGNVMGRQGSQLQLLQEQLAPLSTLAAALTVFLRQQNLPQGDQPQQPQ
ncbi:uncharacterized protein [Dermacentor albipictus]|uniref:uncharacterized protein n=1 Tax=Dermacentor albipictus TaxID=60249 RepID=UPI0031FC5C80